MMWPAPRAVIFDLDGTLAESRLDFDAIRSEIGLRPELPILEQLADADPSQIARA
jgi:FMN phosphatase YigB (HAD superfamily)